MLMVTSFSPFLFICVPVGKWKYCPWRDDGTRVSPCLPGSLSVLLGFPAPQGLLKEKREKEREHPRVLSIFSAGCRRKRAQKKKRERTAPKNWNDVEKPVLRAQFFLPFGCCCPPRFFHTQRKRERERERRVTKKERKSIRRKQLLFPWVLFRLVEIITIFRVFEELHWPNFRFPTHITSAKSRVIVVWDFETWKAGQHLVQRADQLTAGLWYLHQPSRRRFWRQSWEIRRRPFEQNDKIRTQKWLELWQIGRFFPVETFPWTMFFWPRFFGSNLVFRLR